MTVKKSLKRRVRARMGKTGERYAAARRQVVAKADRASEVRDRPEAAPGEAVARAGSLTEATARESNGPDRAERHTAASTPEVASPGMSDAALRRRTGRGWDEWLALIDAWGGAERTHPEIAAWLMAEHNVDGWWAQSVTVGYERARGKRAMGQLVDGFSANASKTVNVPIARLYEAVADGRRRARWLPGAPFTVSSATPHKSVRGAWEDVETALRARGHDTGTGKRATKRSATGSRVSIELTSKGEGKSQLQVQHTRLRDAAASESLKAFWRARLAELKRILEE